MQRYGMTKFAQNLGFGGEKSTSLDLDLGASARTPRRRRELAGDLPERRKGPAREGATMRAAARRMAPATEGGGAADGAGDGGRRRRGRGAGRRGRGAGGGDGGGWRRPERGRRAA